MNMHWEILWGDSEHEVTSVESPNQQPMGGKGKSQRGVEGELTDIYA